MAAARGVRGVRTGKACGGNRKLFPMRLRVATLRAIDDDPPFVFVKHANGIEGWLYQS